jgi:NAD(P)-dependent dehydrogenase (short-subunit alcohol dehydrogenase family)
MPAAVVTYADTGSGPAIVSRLTDDGMAVQAIPGKALSTRAELGRTVAAACRSDRLDILINNTPAFSPGRVLDTPTSAFARGLDEGLNAVFSACREAAAEATRRDTRLTIINVVSALGIVGLEARAAEAAASAGVLAATKALAAEWGPAGIRVTAVVAGPTDEWAASLDDLPGRMPLRRFVTSEDVAAAVSFLAGNDAAAIAGSALLVDGGWLAYGYREDSS